MTWNKTLLCLKQINNILKQSYDNTAVGKVKCSDNICDTAQCA